MHVRTESFWRRLTHRRNDRRPAKLIPRLEPLEERWLCTVSPMAHYDIGTPTLTDVWVDPASGNDAASGATRAEAVRTLAEAWNRIPAGATLAATGYRVLLAPGTYAEDTMPAWWDARHGTFQCPIILQAADGPGTVTLAAIDAHDVAYMYLIGLRLTAHGGDVLHIADSNHVLVRDTQLVGVGDISAYDVPQESLKVNQSQYVFVEDSDISGAWGNAVDFVAVQNGHVIGSKIHHALDWAMYFKGGSAYLRVEGNEIYDAGTGGFSAGQGTGFEYMVAPWLQYETYDVKFVNNVIHDTDGAGIGVNGGYNILMAYNTMYRVGQRGHVIEVVHGLRGCDGNTAQCAANLAAGGWGTATPGRTELIPDRHVYIYNNIVYNPAGYQSQWQQLAIGDPAVPSPGSNIPNPSRAEDDLQIRGNVIWNGPADLPLGIEGRSLLVTEAQLRADNAINTFEPQLVDPAHGDFRPVPGGNVFTAVAYVPPDFAWTDAPTPLVPAGDPSNAVTVDRAGSPRGASVVLGAYTGAAVSQDVFFLHQSVGQEIMDDHGGRPGLVSQIEAAGHGFHDYSLWDSPPGGSVPTQIASLFADGNGDGRYGDLLEGIPGAREAGVLMLKSCFYTLADLENAGALADWQQAFIDDVAAYANQNPQQKLVVMPAVPERRSSGLSAVAAARGRAWSDWLGGDFIADHSTQHNVFSFNLFDFLADPASDPGNANYQREEYLNGDHGDSHPNDTAYSAAADAIAQFVLTTVIGGGNHAPVAGAQSVSTAQDAAVAVTLAASDADHDPLTYEIVAGPASGTLDLAGNVATYTPTAGWHGDDGFTFRAYDGQAWSNAATVGITVYDPNPVVTMPLRSQGSSALLRRSGERIQVVNQRDGQFLLDQPLDSLHSITVTGAVTQSDTLTVDLAGGGFTLAGGILFDGAAGSKTDTLVLRGTTGADTFSVNAVSATVSGLAVQFVRVEQVTLDGGAGDDVYQVAGLGTKTSIADSQGTDMLDFSAAALGVNVNLASSSSQTVFAPSNRNALSLKGTIENAIGTPWADKIRGNSAANRIEGRAGNDTIYGRSGNDWLYGGEGSDSLYGESGNDVLSGGEGDDRLEASTGKNLLIGGLGADYLKGSSGEEILIGGTTVYDGNDAALAAIMAEWTSTRSFRQRTDRLDAGIAYEISQTARLKQRDAMNPDGTVIDDGVRNVLYGGWGSDWFLGFLPTDDVRDRGRADR